MRVLIHRHGFVPGDPGPDVVERWKNVAVEEKLPSPNVRGKNELKGNSTLCGFRPPAHFGETLRSGFPLTSCPALARLPFRYTQACISSAREVCVCLCSNGKEADKLELGTELGFRAS